MLLCWQHSVESGLFRRDVVNLAKGVRELCGHTLLLSATAMGTVGMMSCRVSLEVHAFDASGSHLLADDTLCCCRWCLATIVPQPFSAPGMPLGVNTLYQDGLGATGADVASGMIHWSLQIRVCRQQLKSFKLFSRHKPETGAQDRNDREMPGDNTSVSTQLECWSR